MKYVIISPHYDDEVLGCGGLLAKKSSRHIIYMTESTVERVNESISVNVLIHEKGYTRTSELKYPDGELNTVSIPEVSSRLDHEISRYDESRDPLETTFIPSITLHQDHEYTNRVSLIAARHRKCSILEYEYPEAGLNFSRMIPNYYVPLCRKEVDFKISLMEKYKSQIRSCRDSDAILSLARHRGYECGAEFAEAYNVIRYIQRES